MNAISKLRPEHDSEKLTQQRDQQLLQYDFTTNDDFDVVTQQAKVELIFGKMEDQQQYKEQAIDDENEDSENIPYHARQHAQPFTYGALPEGFKTSELNHIELLDHTDTPTDSPKPIRAHSSQAVSTIATSSPKPSRRPLRPSISSPSRPVLHKTPTREEFEEMLMERREQALREQNNIVTKLAQDAAIRKDLDQLQEKLNRDGILKAATSTPLSDQLRLVETIDLPNANEEKALVKSFEPALILAAQIPSNELHLRQAKRSETPDFPLITSAKSQREERCTSPYPAMMPVMSQEGNTLEETLPNTPDHRVDLKQLKNTTIISNATNIIPQNITPQMVKFAKDSSEFWYKPHMTREQAVNLLRNATPGNFIIRNSTTYRDAYGLVLRVDRPPPGVVIADDSQGDELVRHYLLEPTAQGVRLKGCANVFTSLSALVYQYSIDQMALPCKLVIPHHDLVHASGNAELIAAQKQLLTQGAACNVLYLFTSETEMLTGDEAIRKGINEMYQQREAPIPVEVHFKVSQQGITLTDNKRHLFFRRHYTAQNISHISIDPDNHFWTVTNSQDGLEHNSKKTIFAFVARPLAGSKDNQCHVFCDLASNTQPASAIVSFAHKVLPLNKQHHKLL